MSSDSENEEVNGYIEVTGNKDDVYNWKLNRNKKIKIHINGFSDLHSHFSRCNHCSGAYQSKTILQKHILQYHYAKKSVKFSSQELQPKSPSQPSTSAAAYSHKNRSKRKRGHTRSSRCTTPDSSSSSDSSTNDEGLVEDRSSSEVETDNAHSKKIRKPRRSTSDSDFSDEGDNKLTVDEMKTWLQKHTTPIEKLKSYAYKTLEKRMKHATDLSTEDFLKIWPLYFKINGLYDCDFQFKMKKVSKFGDVWPNLSHKVIQHAGGEEHIKNILGVYVNRLTTEQKEMISVMILPNLIRSKKKSKEDYFSASESRDAFFRVVPHDPKRAKQQALKNVHTAPLQPYILMTGKMSALSFTTYNVVIDGQVIGCSDFLTAMDCCYKGYWIFNCEFPHETEQIWRAIGILVYYMDSAKLLPSTQKIVASFLQ